MLGERECWTLGWDSVLALRVSEDFVVDSVTEIEG